MTRRSVLGFTCSIIESACSRSNSNLYGELVRLEQSNNLAILRTGLTAFTQAEPNAGRLELPDCCFGKPSVSPDARCLGWLPTSSNASLNAPAAIVCIKHISGSIVNVSLDAKFCTHVALSSGGMRLAISASVGYPASNHIILFNFNNGPGPRDITKEIDRLNAGTVDRLRLSADGRILAIGSKSGVSVVNLDSYKTIFAEAGTFPALSPAGDKLGFIDKKSRLVVHDFVSGKDKVLLDGRVVYATGQWSPEGGLILASAQLSPLQKPRLIVVNRSGTEFLEIAKLGQGDFGSSYCWIDRKLLTVP